MKNIKAQELLEKYESGKASPEEKAMLESWYLMQEASADLKPEALLEDHFRIKDALLHHIKPAVKLWPRIAAAAAILIVLSAGYLFLNTSKVYQNLHTKNNDIPPGKNSATLVLSNGRRIFLSDAVKGHIADESGVSITRTADKQVVYTVKDSGIHGHEVPDMNTLSTANGQQYQVRLPDSTRVWLNAASSLKYPVSFASLKERRVELIGEGYFEVKKDKAHPFIVKTTKQEVKVLGTHFNINSYADEPTKTTLLEGSVQVNGYVVIKPGEQATGQGTEIKVTEADTEEALAWRNGDFIFKEEPLESIMRKVSRWYNVEVIFAEDATKNIKLGGFVSRSKNISAVLKMMELTKRVQFKVEGRKIIVLNVNN